MLIHSFATDGYYDFAVAMLTSFKKQHGDSIPFLLHTMDFSDEMIAKLKKIYKELTIKNSQTNWRWLIEKSGMSKGELLRGKRRVEKEGRGYTAPAFAHWKHYISIYERYKRSLLEAFDFAGEDNRILHLDIDLFINRKLGPIFSLIRSADVCLLLRPRDMPEWKKTYGCILGFTVNKQSREFLRVYHGHINSVAFNRIPKGFGQTALWRAWLDLKESDVEIAQIPRSWVNKGFKPKAFIFSANIGRPKAETARRYRKLANV